MSDSDQNQFFFSLFLFVFHNQLQKGGAWNDGQDGSAFYLACSDITQKTVIGEFLIAHLSHKVMLFMTHAVLYYEYFGSIMTLVGNGYVRLLGVILHMLMHVGFSSGTHLGTQKYDFARG